MLYYLFLSLIIGWLSYLVISLFHYSLYLCFYFIHSNVNLVCVYDIETIINLRRAYLHIYIQLNVNTSFCLFTYSFIYIFIYLFIYLFIYFLIFFIYFLTNAVIHFNISIFIYRWTRVNWDIFASFILFSMIIIFNTLNTPFSNWMRNIYSFLSYLFQIFYVLSFFYFIQIFKY